MEIAQNRYEAALNTSAINANTTAQIQSVKDMMAQNKIEALQAQINALELQNAVAGVVRYPNAWVYDAGKAPFCTCTTTPTTGA
jgi:subtilase family serine protease